MEKFKGTAEDDSENSFLSETNLNKDISDSLREEIEDKFRRSDVNCNYIFPRVHNKPKLTLNLAKYLPTLPPKSSRLMLKQFGSYRHRPQSLVKLPVSLGRPKRNNTKSKSPYNIHLKFNRKTRTGHRSKNLKH